jgi:hypothetical protein
MFPPDGQTLTPGRLRSIDCPVPTAFLLALRQLADPAILRILVRSLLVTLAVFAVLGTGGWYALDAVLARWSEAEGLRGLAALVLVIGAGWLLWRIIAFAVLQFHADRVVEAVEARHYPEAHARARPLSWQAEVRLAGKGALRALVWNLAALPFAAVLLVTAIGPAVVFWVVNAVLMGRELTELVWLRHAPDARSSGLPLRTAERFALGGTTAGLFFVPFAGLLAPVLGAAMATHAIHRKGSASDAP